MNKVNAQNSTYLPSKILKENVPFFFLLLVACITLYANTINGQFLTADDIPGIVNNPAVKDLQASLKTGEVEKFYPAVVYNLFGMNPIVFHITSILLHFINAVLVYVFILILFGRTEATITTLIFLTHPINAEAVSWISAYGYLIYGLFTILILTSYVLWTKTKDKRYFNATILMYVLGLIVYRKPWIALVPVYVFLIDQLILTPKPSVKTFMANIKIYLWFAAPTLIYFFTWVRETLAFRQNALVTIYYNDPATATPYFNRILFTIYNMVKLLFWPSSLTIYHEGELFKSATQFAVVSGMLALLVVVLVIYLFRPSKKIESTYLKRYIGTLILIIFATMALSFYPEVLVWAMAERYMYLASIFFGLILALLYTRTKYKTEMKYFLIILITIFCVRTLVRTNDWKNSKNLWIATQKVSPNSYRVYNNIGDVYATEGDYQKAIKYFQIAIQLSPGFADAVHNLGYTYYQLGDIEQAKYYLQRSYQMNSNMYQALYKLGVIAYQENDLPTAKAYFEQAYKVNPDYPPTVQALQILNAAPAPAPAPAPVQP